MDSELEELRAANVRLRKIIRLLAPATTEGLMESLLDGKGQPEVEASEIVKRVTG